MRKMRRKQVATVLVEILCDCGGRMKAVEQVGMQFIPLIGMKPHKCENCGREEGFDKQHPRLAFCDPNTGNEIADVYLA